MAQREKGGRVVFIGNIPYGVSEEEIMQLFGDCGPVLGFRLVYDKETGQPKGFGFLEYSDVDSAAQAVKHLNNHTLHGRTLRVDYSNENRGTTNQGQKDESNRAPPPAHFSLNGATAGRNESSTLPALPPGIELPLGITAFDAISQTISKIDTPQLLDFISQLKNLCASNPSQANVLLQQAPQLGYAVFQAMLLLNLVDTNIVSQLVASAAPPMQQAAPPQHAPTMPPAQLPAPVAFPPQPPQGYPPPYGQVQAYPPGYAPTPPQGQVYQAPPPQPIPQQPPPPAQDQQAQLMQQVMALSREQIFAMPEGPRNQIIALRAQYGAPV